jgi:LysM repeat protein
VIHVVAKGDNLLAISYQYDVDLQALIEANEIENPRVLSVGQRLLIPREEGVAAADQPTATPTPMPVQVINLAFHDTPAGSLWAMGEIAHERDESLELVRMRVILYNVDGKRVDEAEGSTLTDVVPGRGKAPFALLFPSPPASGFASHEVIVLGAEPILSWGGRHRELVVENLRAEKVEGAFLVWGDLANEGEADATEVTLTVTAYGPGGEVVGVRQASVEPLAAGERRAFSLSLIPAAPATRAGAVAWGMKNISSQSPP